MAVVCTMIQATDAAPCTTLSPVFSGAGIMRLFIYIVNV